MFSLLYGWLIKHNKVWESFYVRCSQHLASSRSFLEEFHWCRKWCVLHFQQQQQEFVGDKQKRNWVTGSGGIRGWKDEEHHLGIGISQEYFKSSAAKWRSLLLDVERVTLQSFLYFIPKCQKLEIQGFPSPRWLKTLYLHIWEFSWFDSGLTGLVLHDKDFDHITSQFYRWHLFALTARPLLHLRSPTWRIMNTTAESNSAQNSFVKIADCWWHLFSHQGRSWWIKLVGCITLIRCIKC